MTPRAHKIIRIVVWLVVLQLALAMLVLLMGRSLTG